MQIPARKDTTLNKIQVILTLATLALGVGLAAFGVFPITLTAVSGAIVMIPCQLQIFRLYKSVTPA